MMIAYPRCALIDGVQLATNDQNIDTVIDP
jgi:hypothetical protein